MASRRRLPLAAAAFATWAASAAPGVPDAGGAGGEALRDERPAGPREVLETGLRAPAFRLWELAGYGNDLSEHAAWVIAGSGGPAWRAWPSDRRYLQARWTGPTPADAIAIVHTHPAAVNPLPSPQDRATAAQLGLTVYTVSRSGIWKVEPGGAVTRVRDEHWWDGCGRGSACRESVPGPLVLAEAGFRGTAETEARELRITR
jgi:hypothetical protein